MQALDVRVDQVTRHRLGEQSLAEVAAHLWPESCASCLRPLGAGLPALSISATRSLGRAELHHFSCRHPTWQDLAVLPHARPRDYRAQAFLLHCREGDAAQVRPVLLVNPSLGQVMLAQRAGRWRVATVENAGALGLRPGAAVATVPASGGKLLVRVQQGMVCAQLADGQEWTARVDGAVLRQIRVLRGVMLAVTSAVHPGQVATVADVMSAVVAGRVALGWVPVRE